MQFDFTLPANGAQQIDVVGRFVKYVGGTGKIRVRIDKGGYVDLLPGQAVRNVQFSQITISDRSGAGNVGIVLAGAFDFQDDRISGTVDVVDGGRTRTVSGQAFTGYASQASTIAGQRAIIGLSNPAGSGVRLIVKASTVSSSVAAFVGLVAAAEGFGALVTKSKSKLIGGADGKTDVRTLQQAAYTGSINQAGGFVPASTSLVLVFQEPFVLLPGQGLAWNSQDSAGTGGQMTASFETVEELI